MEYALLIPFPFAICNDSIYKVSEIEVQASRASALMADLKQIVPDVELALGPLLKVVSEITSWVCCPWYFRIMLQL